VSPEAGAPDRRGLVRAFVIYTLSRIAVFAFFVVLAFLAGLRGLVALLAALLVSGIISYFLLARQRTAFATTLEASLQRRTRRVSTRTAREDAIADQLAALDQGLDQDRRSRSTELG
jgi:Flp pilus assembly protein TadB